MSKLYAVIQICPERHYDYKMDTIRESFSVGLPFVFSDRKRAYQEAEKKRKAHVPCFVKEFPFNPLDKQFETLKAKVQSDAEYIGDLEHSVDELDEENIRLRGVLESYAKAFEGWAAENIGRGRQMDGPDWLSLANELRMERDGVCAGTASQTTS